LFSPTTFPEEPDLSVSLRRRVLTLAALASAPLLVQYPALADQSSVTVAQSAIASIAPGASGRVDLAETNAGPAASFSTLTFTAPAGAKFADTKLYFDGQQVKYVSCALSDGDATLSCSADAALVFPANATTQVGVDVRVPADAAAASTLSGGSMSVPSVSSAAWAFSVSTAQQGSGSADAVAPASGTDSSVPADAPKPAAVTNTVAGPTHTDPTPDPGSSDDTNLVPPASGSGDCLCGQQVYTVKMLATEYIRSGPGTQYAILGQVAINTNVNVSCKVNGQVIDGNPRWYRLYGQTSDYIAARWAQDLNGVPPFC
jgi:hypothetical protein